MRKVHSQEDSKVHCLDNTDVLIKEISALSLRAKGLLQEDNLAGVNEALERRQQLIQQLVELEQPDITTATRTFLQGLLADDETQLTQLEQLKAEVKSQQYTTRRSIKSINRYLDVKKY